MNKYAIEGIKTLNNFKRAQKIMKVFIIFIFTGLFSVYAGNSYSQETAILFTKKSSILKELLNEIERKSNYIFALSEEAKTELNTPITLASESESVTEILKIISKQTKLEYRVLDMQVVFFKETENTPSTIARYSQQQIIEVRGRVTDTHGEPLAGVTILLKNTTQGTTTDFDGNYSLHVNAPQGVLVFSFIGFKSKEITVPKSETVNIVLEEDVAEIKELVVTGIFTRRRESFTGSTSIYNAEDIKSVGSNNVIQSLKTLDPSFAIIDNNLLGSDPNRLPDIEIRGKSSLLGLRDELAEDPNQPLFILDGFESSLRAIYDLDMDRVESITILKDAASTAIYGSKAANGVVVVETVKPKEGELKFNYNGTINLSIPDLSSYNMMDASEKLEFEKLAGRYYPSSINWAAEREYALNEIYNNRLSDIARGINTYWLSEPLRLGLNHRHSLYTQGGSGGFMFGIGAMYNGVQGVMRKSDRQNIGGNLDIIYRISKFQFSNKIQIGTISSENPIVPFNQYVNANPYYMKRDENGEIAKWLEYNDLFQAPNPMWNDNIGSRNKSKEFNLSNYFIAEYMPQDFFRLRAKVGLTYITREGNIFLSPEATQFDNEDILNKGSYNYSNNKNIRFEGELTATYATVLQDFHRINLVFGGNVSSNQMLEQGYEVKGFPPGKFDYPSFAKGYTEGGKPLYIQADNRGLSAFINGGYSFDDKYNLDLSYRINGSSVFGSTKQMSGTWSAGLAWNIHREKFFRSLFSGVKMFKIRGSVGNPGNQNFSSYMALSTYRFNFNAINYFGMSSNLHVLGNPDLQWQKTLDKNIGFDLTIMDNRLTINSDFYHKHTDPLLLSIAMPSSSGVTSTYTNMGNQVTKGFTTSVQYFLIYRPQERYTWSIRGNIRSYIARLNDLGNSLSEMNKLGQTNNQLKRYYDGADPDALWAVRSAGIDPATGREIFLKKDGGYTYDFKYEDEVIVGNSRPKIEGVLGTGFTYKGLSVNVDFRYQIGGYAFNRAVFDKVENITFSQLNFNQDKRALYERWKEPGDIVSFKDITNAQSTPMSSRFIQKDNTLTLESLRVGYEISNSTLKQKFGISSMRVNAYMNEIFRISTIKAERGITYPFARSISTSLSLNF